MLKSKKKYAYFNLLTFLFCLAGFGCQVQKPQSSIGLGWAKNSVNAVVFRHNSVVTYKNTQYAAYYDSTGHVVLAKRNLTSNKWEVKKTNYMGNIKDAHNSISIMVDGEGFLHMSWDHHGHPLRYARSKAPGSLELTEKLPMTGKHEQNVTYPEFYKLADGNLLFLFRSGGSGGGNLILNKYLVKDKKWIRLHDILVDGEGERNAYWQVFADATGTIHLSWVWRETGDVATNHDMGYARSTDGGVTWRKTTGEQYQMPINAKNAEYAAIIPQKSELINQTSMNADAKGNPYIATYFRTGGSSIPQYQLIYHDGKQWYTQQVSDRKTAFSLSGGGSKKIPMSRPQIIVISGKNKDQAYLFFRDAERQSKVSVYLTPDLKAGKWTVKDLTSDAVDSWEPSYDTELWKEKKILHLFVQRTGQGDGEKLENLPAQPVRILEWKPRN